MEQVDDGRPAEILVAFRRGKGAPAWAARHARSPVPGRWPYGLEALSEEAGSVTVELPETRGVRGRVGRLSRFLPRSSAVARGNVALCWDELTAADLRTSVRAERYFSGVIWATDSVRDDAGSAALRRTADTLRKMDGLWVLSRPQVDAVRKWLGPGCPPVHFLPFGVDPDFYRARPYPSRPHVVSVGGDRDRDAQTLFAALDIVRRTRADVACTVQSTSTIEPPGGVTKISRLAHTEVAALLGEASVVAIATRPNLHASGMTVGLEALAVGRPVVACATPGMDDYFTPDSSELVSPGDPAAMAAAIIRFLDDPTRAARAGVAGREAVLARHTTRTMCRELAALVRR